MSRLWRAFKERATAEVLRDICCGRYQWDFGERMGNSRRVGALISYIYMATSVVVQLIYVPLLLGSIGQDEYGLYQLIGSIMSYVISINGVLSAGIGRFYCKYVAEDDQIRAENTLAISRRICWAMSALALAAISVLAVAFRNVYVGSFTNAQIDECMAMIFVLGVNMAVTMNNTISIAAITAHERFVFLKLSSLVVLLAQPVFVIALTSYFPNALTVTLVILAMNMACTLVQSLYRRNVLQVGKRYYGWDSRLAKGLFSFSGAIIMVTLADQIFWKADQLIVGYMYGAGSVAIYAVGAQIYYVYMNIGSAAGAIFLPRVSELYHRDHDTKGMSELFVKFGRMNGLLLLFILGGFTVFGQDFIYIWIGDGYFDSYLVALLVMAPFTIDLIQNLGLTILQVTNQYHFRGVMYLAIAVLNIFLTFVLLSVWGLPGAAISTGVSMVIGNGLIMNWYYSKRVGLDIPRFWKEMAHVAFPAVVAVLISAAAYSFLPFSHGSLSSFILGCLLYSLAYISLEWLIGMNAYEKDLVKSLLRKVGIHVKVFGKMGLR